MYICISISMCQYAIIGSGNSQLLGFYQAIAWTNADLLSIEP